MVIYTADAINIIVGAITIYGYTIVAINVSTVGAIHICTL